MNRIEELLLAASQTMSLVASDLERARNHASLAMEDRPEGSTLGDRATRTLLAGLMEDARRLEGRLLAIVREWDGPSQFERTLLCEPHPASADECRLHEMAKEYHKRTEAFDRTVCTGPIRDGQIMPASGHQQLLISSNAAALRQEIWDRERGKMDNAVFEDFIKAIQRFDQ